jgi:hypothetical protein
MKVSNPTTDFVLMQIVAHNTGLLSCVRCFCMVGMNFAITGVFDANGKIYNHVQIL